MKSLKYTVAVLGLAALSLTSCSDFLDEMPDNRTTLDTPEKVANLLVSAYPTASYRLTNEYMSDNSDSYGMSNPYGDRFADQLWAWQDVTEFNNESPERLWMKYYLAIANCNQALQSIDELGGATTTELRQDKAEALLCRAFAHFVLVNEFSLGYSESTKDSLGVPYVDKVVPITEHFDRMKIGEVYANIEKDIEEALPMVGDNYSVPKYHFNTKAAYAFATRFYLFYEKWDKAVECANRVLGSNPSADLRDWAVMSKLTRDPDAYSQHWISADLNCNLLLSTAVSEDGVAFGPYSYYKRYSHGTYLGKNEDISAEQVWGTSSSFYFKPEVYNKSNVNYCQYWKTPYLFEYTDPVARTGLPHTVDVLFSTDETLLNRAEAYVMLKQYDKAAADLTTWLHSISSSTMTITPAAVQKFYNSVGYCYDDANHMLSTVKKHLHPGFAIDAEGSVQETMLQCVLNAKRIATMHDGLRWWDVKRYGMEIVRREIGQNGTPVRLLDVLKVKDPRRAIQIPQQSRDAGTTPNPRYSEPNGSGKLISDVNPNKIAK